MQGQFLPRTVLWRFQCIVLRVDRALPSCTVCCAIVVLNTRRKCKTADYLYSSVVATRGCNEVATELEGTHIATLQSALAAPVRQSITILSTLDPRYQKKR